MFKKLKLILVVLVISHSIEISSITTGGGLKSEYFCKNELLTSKCLEKHSVKCEEGSICSINNEQCDRFNLISNLFDKKMLKIGKQYRKNMNAKEQQFVKFKQSIRICNGMGDLNRLFCLNNFDCIQNRRIIIHGYVIRNEIRKMIDCRCQGSYQFQCNRNYCANDLSACEIIHKLNVTQLNIKNCGNKNNYTLIQRLGIF